MTLQQVNITLGTAGHIDHGKTALIRLLTGCETDRLKEEKERGMSIELGFAPCKVADVEIGIVDVPGHEHFVKTMVAGATGIDGVILVVAADDGVMPQTLEHLQILTLLGLRHGVVALTKIDRVTPEHLARVRDDIETLLLGTFLEGAPILPISNITGVGFDGFYYGLADLVRSITARRIDGLFRMPVERAFSAEGFGTIVSGIPVSGTARLGDEIELLPQRLSGRIRGIEAYGKTSDAVMAGQCAAIQFRHWDHKEISRGDTLAVPGLFSPEEWLLVRLTMLPSTGMPLPSGVRVKLHAGTCDVLARVYPLEGTALVGGTECLAQVNVDTPIVVAPRDRFVIRSLSPVTTVGGGEVVESFPRRLKRNRPGVREDAALRAAAVLDERSFVEYAVRHAASLAVAQEDIALRTKVPTKRLQAILASLVPEGVLLAPPGGRYTHRDAADELDARILAAVSAFHAEAAASAGVVPERLQETLAVDKDVLAFFIERLLAGGRLVRRNSLLALPSHKPALSDKAHETAERVERLFRDRLYAPPVTDEAAAALGLTNKEVEAAMKVLVERGTLVRVSPEFLFHKSSVDTAREKITAHITEKGSLPSVDFKYLIDTTRKYAIPLLDYFDKISVTRRIGNTRYLKIK